MSVSGNFLKSSGDSNSVSITIKKSKKEIRKDGKIVRDRKELIYNLPCILFSHEDISFIRGSQEEKRWFFNQTMCLEKDQFLDELRVYNKILKSRNNLLKENNQKELLDLYTDQLIEKGFVLMENRRSFLDIFNALFSQIVKEIGGLNKDLMLVYQPSWRDQNKNEIRMRLESNNFKEKSLGITMSGPHRDRFFFISGNRDYAATASTGQIRLLSLILRSAQALYYSRITNKKPLLLLDDVLLELDGMKRDSILKNIPPYEQIFFTFLPEEKNRFSNEKCKEFLVIDGEVSEV
jgi:DNA replication and repair protein RecF